MPGLAVIAALVTGGLTASCKEKRPPNHPVVGIRDRNAARIELVELIIKDSERAQQVKGSYQQITALVDEFAATRAEHERKIALLSSTRTLPEAEIRAEVAKLREAGKQAYQRYVKLQLDVRKHTTAKEFARLDEVR